MEKGVELFNGGSFFECHDVLEDLWSGVRGDSRDFFQGLIQVSVALYHVDRGNTLGARSMLDRALKRFEAYPTRYFGFDLESHQAELRAWRERLASGAPPLDSAPEWRFDLG